MNLDEVYKTSQREVKQILDEARQTVHLKKIDEKEKLQEAQTALGKWRTARDPSGYPAIHGYLAIKNCSPCCFDFSNFTIPRLDSQLEFTKEEFYELRSVFILCWFLSVP
jgi:hypothetical protein